MSANYSCFHIEPLVVLTQSYYDLFLLFLSRRSNSNICVLLAVTQNSNNKSMYLDFTVFLLVIQFAKLGFLLVIVDGSDENDDDDGNQNGDSLDPGDFWVSGVVGSVVAVIF